MNIQEFNPCDPDTWRQTLTDLQVAAIYQVNVETVRRKCRTHAFVPAPIANLFPRRWRKGDVLRHVEGARGGSLRRVV